MEHRGFGTTCDGIEKLEGLTAVRQCLMTICPDLKGRYALDVDFHHAHDFLRTPMTNRPINKHTTLYIFHSFLIILTDTM